MEKKINRDGYDLELLYGKERLRLRWIQTSSGLHTLEGVYYHALLICLLIYDGS